MFGTTMLERRSKPERIADQAWEHLVSAINSASGSARSAKRRTSHFADEAGDRVGSTADEAWQRATTAFDALAGRRPGLPWTWIMGAGLIGAAVGWAAATAARTAIASGGDESRTNGRVEFVDVDRPSTPVSLDN